MAATDDWEEIEVAEKDDWEESKKLQVPKKQEESTSLEAGLKGFASGITMGWYDEALGGLNASVEKLKQQFGPEITNAPSFTALYEKERDAIRDNLKALEKKHGAAFLAGEVAGGVTGAFIPGGLAVKGAGSLAKGASLLVRAGKGIKGAAGAGAVAGAGTSEAKEIQEVAKDAAKGAVLGLGLGAAGVAVGAGIKKALPLAEKFTRNKAIKSLGFTHKNFLEMPNSEQSKILVLAHENKLLSQAPHESQDIVRGLKKAAGQELDRIYSNPKLPKLVNDKELVKEIEEEVLSRYKSANDEVIRNRLKIHLNDIKEASVTPQGVRDFRSRLGEMLGEAKSKRETRTAKADKHVFKLLTEHMRANVEKAGDTSIVEAYEKYHLLSSLDHAVGKLVILEGTNPGMFAKVVDNPVKFSKYAIIAMANPLYVIPAAAFEIGASALKPRALLSVQQKAAAMLAKKPSGVSKVLDTVSPGRSVLTKQGAAAMATEETKEQKKKRKATQAILKNLQMPNK